jgi:hypothetical protein
VGSRAMARAGWPVDPGSFSPSVCYLALSPPVLDAARSRVRHRQASVFRPTDRVARSARFSHTSCRRGRPSGSSMPNDPSLAHSRSSTMSGGTRTASPSLTIGSTTSTTTRCASLQGLPHRFRPSREDDDTGGPCESPTGARGVRSGARIRIRYYGFLGPCHRKEKLARCRQLLATPVSETTASASVANSRDRHTGLTGVSLHPCPVCHRGRMLIIDHLPRACVTLSIVDSS